MVEWSALGDGPLRACGVRWGVPLSPARFVRRLNRFAALVEVEGRLARAHVPNSGRLGELLVPGNRVWLVPGRGVGRSTAWDLLLAAYPAEVSGPGSWRGTPPALAPFEGGGATLVSVDARLPTRLVARALAAGALPELRGYEEVVAEPRVDGGRLDFLLRGGGGRCLVEVKSVTLRDEAGLGRFPDAPTARGARHVEALRRAVESGTRGVVLFVVQREDVVGFRPHDGADPAFGRELRRAAATGVEVVARRCRVTMEGITLAERVPVDLTP